MDMDKDDDNIVFHESTDSNEMEDTSLETLSVEDWVTIQSVRSSFLSLFQNEHVDCPCSNASIRSRFCSYLLVTFCQSNVPTFY